MIGGKNKFHMPAADSFSALLGDVAEPSMATAEPTPDKRLHLEKSLTRWVGLPAVNSVAIKSPAYLAAAEQASLSLPAWQLNARAEGVVGHLLFEGLAAAMSLPPPHHFSPNLAAVQNLLRNQGVDDSAAASTAAR